MKRHSLKFPLPLAILGGLALMFSWPATAAVARPNIVFILADDLGYGDIGCYGNKDIRTPDLDKLATQGVRFSQFYSNGPECTPTRTAFLTGRYQQRVGGMECALGVGNVGRYDDAIRLREKNEMGLPASEVTISRLLKDAGYATAIIGKWHLGYEPKFFPKEHGFDYWFGVIGGNADYFRHTEQDGLNALYLNGQPVKREGYMTDLITEEAVKYVERAKGNPFFLYVAYTAPHAPIQGPNDRREQALTGSERNQGDKRTYHTMIERMDDGIGRILHALEANGRAQNSLVVFTSDNGGTKLARNEPLRGTKGTTFEGGIRVPCLVRWPGVLPAGVTTDLVGITMDLTASFARVGGARLPEGRTFDGVDILSEVSGKGGPTRTLFWRGRRGENTWKAVREGPLKYVMEIKGDQRQEYFFDVQSDSAEKMNLLSARPDDLTRLKTLLADWEVAVRPRR
ncbi:MAG: sulfatase-like hydrolase/transferase [Verrucomicrobia bacterium]|nr:sulfatase-like hydrolase/transferase [Verrucomicrobiota bacterium]